MRNGRRSGDFNTQRNFHTTRPNSISLLFLFHLISLVSQITTRYASIKPHWFTLWFRVCPPCFLSGSPLHKCGSFFTWVSPASWRSLFPSFIGTASHSRPKLIISDGKVDERRRLTARSFGIVGFFLYFALPLMEIYFPPSFVFLAISIILVLASLSPRNFGYLTHPQEIYAMILFKATFVMPQIPKGIDEDQLYSYKKLTQVSLVHVDFSLLTFAGQPQFLGCHSASPWRAKRGHLYLLSCLPRTRHHWRWYGTRSWGFE